MLNIDKAKSYSTREKLEKALRIVGLAAARPVIVRNTEGRWTAIFGGSLSGIQNPFDIARKGFFVIN